MLSVVRNPLQESWIILSSVVSLLVEFEFHTPSTDDEAGPDFMAETNGQNEDISPRIAQQAQDNNTVKRGPGRPKKNAPAASHSNHNNSKYTTEDSSNDYSSSSQSHSQKFVQEFDFEDRSRQSKPKRSFKEVEYDEEDSDGSDDDDSDYGKPKKVMKKKKKCRRSSFQEDDELGNGMTKKKKPKNPALIQNRRISENKEGKKQSEGKRKKQVEGDYSDAWNSDDDEADEPPTLHNRNKKFRMRMG